MVWFSFVCVFAVCSLTASLNDFPLYSGIFSPYILEQDRPRTLCGRMSSNEQQFNHYINYSRTECYLKKTILIYSVRIEYQISVCLQG